MSKGIGKLQSAVIDAVRRANGTESDGEICWKLAKSQNKIGTDGVESSFYSSFRRAMRSLIAAGLVEAGERQLLTSAEVIAHYPYKTRDAATHRLRVRLLATAFAYAEKHPRFTIAEAERHDAHELTEDKRSDYRRRWRPIRLRLLNAACQCSPRVQPVMICLLAKAESVARSELALTCNLDWARLFRAARADADAAEVQACLDDLDALVEEFLPAEDRKVGTLKGLVYAVMNHEMRATVTMHRAAKAFLLETKPELVTQLPGHSPADPDGWGLEPRYSEQLDDLIGRDVFAAIRFPRIAPQGSAKRRVRAATIDLP